MQPIASSEKVTIKLNAGYAKPRPQVRFDVPGSPNYSEDLWGICVDQLGQHLLFNLDTGVLERAWLDGQDLEDWPFK